MTISAPREVLREFMWLCHRRGKSGSEVLREFVEEFVDSRSAEIEARDAAPCKLSFFPHERDIALHADGWRGGRSRSAAWRSLSHVPRPRSGRLFLEQVLNISRTMDRFDDVKRQWASRCWQCGEKFAEGEERQEYGIGLWCHPACWQDVLVGMEAEVEARSAECGVDEEAHERLLEEFMEHDSRERRQEAFTRTQELFGVAAAKRHRRIADEAMRCAGNRKKPTA